MKSPRLFSISINSELFFRLRSTTEPCDDCIFPSIFPTMLKAKYYKYQLFHRTQSPGETLSSLAMNIVRLVQLAYPKNGEWTKNNVNNRGFHISFKGQGNEIIQIKEEPRHPEKHLTISSQLRITFTKM